MALVQTMARDMTYTGVPVSLSAQNVFSNVKRSTRVQMLRTAYSGESFIVMHIVNTITGYVAPDDFTIEVSAGPLSHGANQSRTIANAIISQIPLLQAFIDFYLTGEYLALINWSSTTPGVVVVPTDFAYFELSDTLPIRPISVTINDEEYTFDGPQPQAVFHAMNTTLINPRGNSPIAALAPFLTIIEDAIVEAAQSGPVGPVWFAKVFGADESVLRNFLRENPPPTSGSVRAHNESVEWYLVEPKVQPTTYAEYIERVARTSANLAGIDIDQSAISRSVAALGEAMNPTVQSIRRLRNEWFTALELTCNTILSSMQLPPVSIKGKDLRVRDVQRLAGAFARVVAGLTSAVDAGIIDKQRANEIFENLASQLE